MRVTLYLSYVIASLVLLACQSGPTPRPPIASLDGIAPFYSEEHIDFAGWNRTGECCSATGKSIAIASGGTFSSKAGVDTHKEGGNAVDAAVATAFALAVERPHSLGLGGGGFMTLALPEQKPFFVDFRETAPRKAKRDMFLTKKGEVVPDLSTVGVLAVGTPGFVAGLVEIHERWGRLPLRTVLDPAVRLARNGFPVYRSLARRFEEEKERLQKSGYLKKIFFTKKGEPLKVGELLVQTDLAKVIEHIGRKGKSAFYEGKVAKQIVDFVRSKNGILDETDLKEYKVRYREPIRGAFKGFSILTAPPPSAGGILFVEMFNVLDGINLEKEVLTPERYLHLLSEIFKRAYADRSLYVGDPDVIGKTPDFLMDPKYADNIRKEIRWEKATPSKEVSPGKPVQDIPGTTHFSLLDEEGGAVSCTLTINGPFGAYVAAPGTGVILNNEMDDFSMKAGTPNLFGLTGAQANEIAAKKRPVSSMSPTIVFENDKPILVVGGAGGSRIISSVFQTILNDLVVYDRDLKKSVFAPRMHHQWLPDRLELEKGFPDRVKTILVEKGHELAEFPYSPQVQAVGRTTKGNFIAVHDPRDEGGASAE